jgi:hypothetical protein
MRSHTGIAAAGFALLAGLCDCGGAERKAPPDSGTEADTGTVPAQRDGLSPPDLPVDARDAPLVLDSERAHDAAVGEAPGSGEVGTGRAALSIDRTTVNLGIFELGTTAVTTLTLTNRGPDRAGPLVIATWGLTVTGCDEPLAASSACTLTVAFTPTELGSATGTFAIAAIPGADPPLFITVSAYVTLSGVFTVRPTAIDLGKVVVGIAAPEQTLTVTAISSLSDLTVTTFGQDIGLDQTRTTCLSILAAGASCVVVLNFTALFPGPATDSLVILGGGKVVRIPVTALAQNRAQLLISPSSRQSFVAPMGATSTPVTFVVSNAGDPSGQLSVAVNGEDSAAFAATSTCTQLEAQGSCTVLVWFRGGALTDPPKTALLTVTDLGPGRSSVSVELSGQTVGTGGGVIESQTSDLGKVPVGTLGTPVEFRLPNGGSVTSPPLTVSLSSPEFVITADTCSGTALAPGAACSVFVALKPVSGGSKVAVLIISGGGVSVAKNITGTGIVAVY